MAHCQVPLPLSSCNTGLWAMFTTPKDLLVYALKLMLHGRDFSSTPLCGRRRHSRRLTQGVRQLMPVAWTITLSVVLRCIQTMLLLHGSRLNQTTRYSGRLLLSTSLLPRCSLF